MVQPPGGPGGPGAGGGNVPRELLDVAFMEAVVRNVEKISRAVEKLAGQVEDVAGEAADASKDVSDEATKRFDMVFKRVEGGLQKQEDAIRKTSLEWARFHRELDEAGRKVGNTLSTLSSTSGVQALGSRMLSALPFGAGGILGFLLWGRMREAEFQAAARRSAYVLEQTGGVGSKHLAGLTAQVRTLFQGWGSMGQEVEATLGAFAQFSIAEDAFAKTNVQAKGFMQNVAGIATAMDALTASSPGTTGKLIGEVMQSSGASAHEATLEILALGGALRGAGLNYGVFGQGIVQATSALRLHNQSLSDTQAIFDKLRGRLENLGIDKGKAATMALAGVQAGAGALSAMPMGLQGLVAQSLAGKGAKGFGGMADPIALLTRFRLGAEAGGDQGFMGQAFGSVRDMMMNAFPDRAGKSGEENRLNRIFALSQVGGMSEQAAQAILDGADATKFLVDPSTRTAKATEMLADAFQKRASTESPFEKAMRVAADEMAKLANNLLQATIVGFMDMSVLLEALPLMLKESIPSFGGLDDAEKARLGMLRGERTGFAMSQDAILGDAMKNVAGVAGALVGGGDALISGEAQSGIAQTLARRRREAEAVTRTVDRSRSEFGGRVNVMGLEGVGVDRRAAVEAAVRRAGEQGMQAAAATGDPTVNVGSAYLRNAQKMADAIEKRLQGAGIFVDINVRAAGEPTAGPPVIR